MKPCVFAWGRLAVSNGPFFSVVIPTYNCADFLRRALLSVQAQTCQDYEIIVIDNHSTDHTQEVLAEFAGLPLTRLEIANGGVIAASRNMGIRQAKGEWVAFLDSDDVWLPEKLARVRRAISQDPAVVLVCHDEVEVVSGVAGRVLQYGPAEADMYERLLFVGNAVSTSATAVRRDVLLATGGFSEQQEFVTVEDYEYWLRLSKQGKFLFLTDPLGEYHLHGGNESARIEKHSKALVAVVTHHLESLRQNGYNKARIQKGQGRVWITAARMLLKEGVFDTARHYARKGLACNPVSVKGWIILTLSTLRVQL